MAANPDYEIAIIAALALEARAVMGIFDEIYDTSTTSQPCTKSPGDVNTYTSGRVGRHNVVLVHMPGMGAIDAASVAMSLLASFRALKLVLNVGICGGSPEGPNKAEILLGDVVVSKQVIQLDFGRQYPEGFLRRSSSDSPSSGQGLNIQSFVASLESWKELVERDTSKALTYLLEKPGFGPSKYPGQSEDRLFHPDYLHQHHDARECECIEGMGSCYAAKHSSCEELGCRPDSVIPRRRHWDGPSGRPLVHFGTIASGNAVIKSGVYRNRVAQMEGVIAFEMEGAGISRSLPCVVVKGVCDYADSHKSKLWQEFAAAAASACAKVILERWPGRVEPTRATRLGEDRRDGLEKGDSRTAPKAVFQNRNSKVGIEIAEGQLSHFTLNI